VGTPAGTPLKSVTLFMAAVQPRMACFWSWSCDPHLAARHSWLGSASEGKYQQATYIITYWCGRSRCIYACVKGKCSKHCVIHLLVWLSPPRIFLCSSEKWPTQWQPYMIYRKAKKSEATWHGHRLLRNTVVNMLKLSKKLPDPWFTDGVLWKLKLVQGTLQYSMKYSCRISLFQTDCLALN